MAIKVTPAIAKVVEQIADNAADYIPDAATYATDEIGGRCVLIDPDRCDLSYCMHENSAAEDPQLFRYTRNQQSKERQSKRFSNIRKKVNTKAVEEAEGRLAESPSRTLEITEFIEHLQARAQESPILHEFYERHLAKYQ
ncbi:hypothetical protein BX667DRAFT_513049 [Coemansia mojavensis]|nr:hypothetical protein BX667DRAFT_513049 [Coemansia mojavensis]